MSDVSRLRTVRPLGLLAPVVLVLGACSSPSPSTDLDVGTHRVSVRLPDGWQHADHGREHRFKRGMATLSMVDLGPVGRDGLERETEIIRALWRRGQPEDAGARLRRLPVPRDAFETREDRREFFLWIDEMVKEGPTADSMSMEEAYGALLDWAQSFPEAHVDDVLAPALEELDEDERRDIASRRHLDIQGRDVLVVDTWDRLHHDWRKRFALTINGGHLLVIRTAFGSFEEMEAEFDGLVESLTFRDDPMPSSGSEIWLE